MMSTRHTAPSLEKAVKSILRKRRQAATHEILEEIKRIGSFSPDQVTRWKVRKILQGSDFAEPGQGKVKVEKRSKKGRNDGIVRVISSYERQMEVWIYKEKPSLRLEVLPVTRNDYPVLIQNLEVTAAARNAEDKKSQSVVVAVTKLPLKRLGIRLWLFDQEEGPWYVGWGYPVHKFVDFVEEKRKRTWLWAAYRLREVETIVFNLSGSLIPFTLSQLAMQSPFIVDMQLEVEGIEQSVTRKYKMNAHSWNSLGLQEL